MAGAMRGQLLRLRPWQSAPAAASHTWRPRQQLQQACWQHTAAPAAAAPPSAARASGAQKTVLGFSRFNVVAGCGKSKTKSTISNNPNFCGEDSFFITEDQMSSIGVADGVGGWAECGVDAGVIARGLMSNCKLLSSRKYILPQWLLAEAYWKVKYGQEVVAGSTTACLAALREVRHEQTSKSGQMIFTCNLGDSGWVLLRDHKVIKSSDPLRQSWNVAPPQLAVIPASMKGRGYIESEPYDAVNEGFTVFPNDIIVLATDGLWDNIVMEQIEELSKKAANIELFAKQLVVAGSTRPRKPDDVTVIAARV